MEFEHLHSYYEIHILLSPMATHFIEGIPYRIRTNDFVLLEPSRLHKSFYPSDTPFQEAGHHLYVPRRRLRL